MFTVDATEFAYVTRFGQPVRILHGASDAGLHFKAPWPIDAVLKIDAKLQAFDLPAVESLTRDAQNNTVDKTITADAFIAWKLPDKEACDKFVRTLGSSEQAQKVLAPQVTGRLASTIGGLPLEDLVSVVDLAGQQARSEKLQKLLLSNQLKEQLQNEYGIELVELRIRRLSFPQVVRESIFERIRSERARKVAEYESEGRKRATEILSEADKIARSIEAEAKAKKILLEGQADAEADRIRNDAHSQDRDFYAFLQKLKSYQSILGETRDILLLSAKHPLFDLLLSPPKEKEAGK